MDYIKYVENKLNNFFIKVYFPIGSIHEPKNKEGISHLLEHLKVTTTLNYSKQEFHKDLSNIVLKNAYTTRDHTCYYINSNDKEWKKIIDLMYNIAFSLNINKEIMEQEKNVILQEMLYRNKLLIENNDSEDDISDEISILGNDNPYKKNIIGTIQSIKNIKLKDLKNYNKKYLNDYLIVFSCKKELKNNVLKYCQKKFKEPRKLAITIPENTQLFDYKLLIRNIDFELYSFNFIFKSLNSSDEKNYLINFILNSFRIYPGGLFIKELRMKNNYIYSINLENISYKHYGNIYINTTTKSEKELKESIKIIFKLLNKLKKIGFGKDLDNYKKIYIKKLEFNKDNEELFDFVSNNLFYNREFKLDNYLEKINKIKNEDIINISNIIFDLNKFTLGILGNFNNTQKTEDTFYNIISKQRKL